MVIIHKILKILSTCTLYYLNHGGVEYNFSVDCSADRRVARNTDVNTHI